MTNQEGEEKMFEIAFPEISEDLPFVSSNFIADKNGLVVAKGIPDIVGFITGRMSYPDGKPLVPDRGAEFDTRLMREIRKGADAIMWGINTLRLQKEEDIIPDLLGKEELHSYRLKSGMTYYPHLILVTNSGKIDDLLGLRAFNTVGLEVIILTNEGKEEEIIEQLARAGIKNTEVIAKGAEKLDLREALMYLRKNKGIKVIVCEGGHGLIASLHDEGLLDEAFVTVSDVALPINPDDPNLEPKYLFRFEEEGTSLIEYSVVGEFKFYRWRWQR